MVSMLSACHGCTDTAYWRSRRLPQSLPPGFKSAHRAGFSSSSRGRTQRKKSRMPVYDTGQLGPTIWRTSGRVAAGIEAAVGKRGSASRRRSRAPDEQLEQIARRWRPRVLRVHRPTRLGVDTTTRVDRVMEAARQQVGSTFSKSLPAHL